MSTLILSAHKPLCFDDSNIDNQRPIDTLSYQLTVSDSISNKSNESFHLLLKETAERKKFLVIVGALFCLKTAILALIILFAILKPTFIDYFTHIKYTSFISTLLWITLASCGLIAGFYGHKFRVFLPWYFVLDISLTSFALILSIASLKKTSNNSIMFMKISGFVNQSFIAFFFASLSFSLSLLIPSLNHIYRFGQNFLIGIVIFTISASPIIYNLETRGLTSKCFTAVYLIGTLFLLYICTQANFILSYRLNKFYEDDYFWCHYTFLSDLFGTFWMYLLNIKRKGGNNRSYADESDSNKQPEPAKSLKINDRELNVHQI